VDFELLFQKINMNQVVEQKFLLLKGCGIEANAANGGSSG